MHGRRRRLAHPTIAAAICLLALGAPTASADPAIVEAPCADAPAVTCGTIEVPRDRDTPGEGTVDVAFRLYPHTGTDAEPSGTIVALQGGPGATGTRPPFRNRMLAVFGPARATRQLLLVDQRGRGLSGALACVELQTAASGIPGFLDDIATCGDRLGAAAEDYSSAASAEDLEDLRSALGLGDIDLFGQSYAGYDVEAYATRYPENLRSIIADSTSGSLDDFFAREYVPAFERQLEAVCALAAGCEPRGLAIVARLARSLRKDPLTGTAVAFSGDPVAVTLDELGLLSYIAGNAVPGQLTLGELEAAARAYLRDDDERPLLRLAAENTFPIPPPAGSDVSQFSAAAFIAVSCNDLGDAPWDWSLAPDARRRQYEQALSALDRRAFAPFSRPVWSDWLTYTISVNAMCTHWPGSPTPIVGPAGHPDDVPTLVLAGELDQLAPAELVRSYAELFGGSTYIELAGATHVVNRTLCGTALIRDFVSDLDVDDASCADEPEVLPLATGAFPRRARDVSLSAVQRLPGDRSTPEARRVAVAAVAALTDALKRFEQTGGPLEGVGLRGGTFTADSDPDTGATVVELMAARFTEDVATSGAATYDPATFRLDATLVVDGRRGLDGSIAVSGDWRLPGGEPLTIAGMLGGAPVRLAVEAP